MRRIDLDQEEKEKTVMGWIGMAGDLRRHLEEIGADADEQKRPILAGAIYSFMGMQITDETEIVVEGGAKFFMNGEPRDLADEMKQASLGVKVHVIGG